VTTPSVVITKRYTEFSKLPDIFCFKGQVFNFVILFASVWEGYGSLELLYHKCSYVLSLGHIFFPCPQFFMPIIIIVVLVYELLCDDLIILDLNKRFKYLIYSSTS
jgi:hypothetical protein